MAAWRKDRNATKIRHNEESQETAVNRFKRWTNTEIDYLAEFAKTKTARQLAKVLNRTYSAIIYKCFREHITLMTEDKKHNKLVTKSCVEGVNKDNK